VAISILAEMIRNNREPVRLYIHRLMKQAGSRQQILHQSVCGVPVDMENPKHVEEYGGEKVYFCCDGCWVKFNRTREVHEEMKELKTLSAHTILPWQRGNNPHWPQCALEDLLTGGRGTYADHG